MTVEPRPVAEPPVAEPPAPRGLARAGALTVAAAAATLAVNLLTGVLIARVLGPSGRGAVTAVVLAPAFVAWIFEMGCGAAAAYHQARAPREGARLIATWLAILAPLAILGTVAGELLLPHLLAAQSPHTLHLARILMLTLALTFLGDLMNGILLGDHDYRFYNLVRVVQPLAVALVYGVLWVAGVLTVTTAVATTAVVTALCVGALAARGIARHGLARPSVSIGRRTLWYGARAHTSFAAGLVNQRLDVLIIPAFLGAASVGLYSVATSVAEIVVTVSGSLAAIVLPTAVARGAEGPRMVIGSLYATVGIALALAVVIAALAGFGVPLVYGDAFSGAVTPLRILLLGTVMYAAAGAVRAGLYALDRPFTAAVSQLAPAAVTVAGLVLFLRQGGIQAASIVSTVAYAVVFALALWLYKRAAGLAWKDFLAAPAPMVTKMRRATKGALGRA